MASRQTERRKYRYLPGDFCATVCTVIEKILYSVTDTGHTGDALYSVERSIASGNQGRVYAATDMLSGARVVIKEYSSRGMPALESFENEAHANAILKARLGPAGHPNVCLMTSCFLSRSRKCFTVFPYLPGHTLDSEVDLASSGRLCESLAKSLMLDALRGLECLHSCGVVHLDLKPANIFVTIGPDGSKRAVLIDLGFALTYPNEVKNPFVVHRGTLEFKSLEILQGTPCVGYQCDLWAMAVTLYNLVTGELPFPLYDQATVDGLLTEDFAAAFSLSSELMGLLRECLQIQADKRLSLAAMLSHPWFSAM